MIIIIMGVTGSGKSTIGNLLAEQLSLPFFDADDFHPQENILKMSQGIPLTDEDRYPWLERLSFLLKQQEEKNGAILACSALKEEYRNLLQQGLNEKIIWIYLEGPEEVIRERMKNRRDHFMPDDLLLSQLAIVEKPDYAYCFSIEKEPETIVEEILNSIS
jgi:carbohydrate kinase (thermoresistant glucokinase family)